MSQVMHRVIPRDWGRYKWLRAAPAMSPIGIVGRVIPGEPTVQFRSCVLLSLWRDLLGLRVVDRELDNHVVWIGYIDRTAVAVLQHISRGRRDSPPPTRR